MNQALCSSLIWFLALAMAACQIIPPGTQTQSDLTGGFQIQGRGKPDLKPLLSCVSQSRDGSLLAHFSYENTLDKTISIPVGGQNKFLENPGWGNNEHHSSHKDKQDQHSSRHEDHHSNRRDYQDRGQITLFPPGAGPSWPQSAFSVSFTQERLTWQLGNHSVTAYARDLSQRCQEAEITVAAHTPPRKTLLSAQTVTLTRTQQVFNFSFQASDISDLRRRIAINLINGPDGSPRVADLRIYVNKQPILAQRPEASFLKAEVPNMITEIFNTQFGNNNLELELRGPVGAQVRFSVEGFLRTVYIPGAFHSAIDDHTLIRKSPIHKGIVGIKFMEGMKVRLGQSANQWERLSDETGISLVPLQAMIGYHQISDIVPALPGSVEERDTMEQRTESETGHEAPNQNLFYYLYFDESKDVWEMVDRLSTLPFIEEAYPMFIFSSAQATTTSQTLSPFVPDEVKPNGGLSGSTTPVSNSLWLRSTRIMNSHAGLPTPSPSASPSAPPLAGAWDITQGSSSIKVAALEHGYNKNHEDLGKIQQLVNVSPGSGYTDLDHGTKTMGVIGASKDTSGRGSIGVAHGASVYHIWPWDNQFGSPSLCRGTGAAKCHPTVDALEYAKKEKMQVVLISAVGGGLNPGTVEEIDPDVRVHIRQKITPENIAVIVQAGNRACEGINNSDEFKECSAFFKNGKNIKEIIVREKYLDMRGCQEPPLLTNLHPLVSAIFGLGYWHCINTTPPIVKEKFSSQGDMPDTGSIIVGALKVDGSAMVPPDPPGTSTSTLPYNHGKSRASSDGLETIGGHGTDISGPSEYIYTSTYDSKSNSSYGYFGGTSGASPVITGVVALMLSVNPTLKPKEIRKILRGTEQHLPLGEDISGMVDAYEAVKAAQGLDGGIPGDFNGKFFLPPPAGADPAAFGLKAFYNPNNNTSITARAGDMIGFYTANALTRNISIEIQGKNAVLTAINNNLLTMTVPANLLVGNLDVLFKSDEGEFKIENLINYTSPFPEVVKWSKPTIFANGGDVVDGYITVKDANGQPAPDGTPYYVQLVPTQLGLYPDLTLIHPETGQQYGGRWTTVEQVLPVKNGKIHIQAKLNAPIGPYEYTYDFNNSLPNVFTWPHANAPSFQVQVCNPAYNPSKPGYGYYCGQQLFPQTGNTLDGRLYAVHAYSFDPQIHHVISGTAKRTITIRNIKDILGNPVPVGTVLHFNQTYYGNVSNPNGNDIYWGVAVTTPGEVDIVYEPFQRLYCDLVGVEEYVYMTSVQGAVSNPLHWLVGNPIYFRYVAC